jgi:hypothetical protein
MTQTATGAFDSNFGGNAGPVNAGSDQSSHRSGSCCGWKSGSHGRTRWSALEIVAMVGGFIIFWPLGLLALFLKWKNKEMWPGAAEGTLPFTGLFSKRPSMPSGSFKGFGFGGFSGPSSGNSAFDAYKRQQLDRLEEERRKLDDEQREFHAYLKRLADAKDKDEFDRFMAERNAPKPATE